MTNALNPNEFLEVIFISVKAEDTDIEITKVYIPPVNSITTNYHPNISRLLQDDSRIALGDFNAHHESWHSLFSNDCDSQLNKRIRFCYE